MKPDAGTKQIADLRSDIRGTLALGLPLAGMQLAAIAIHLTDTIMVGWLGAFELGAVVLGTQIIFILWIFGGGFANAILPVAATAQGAGDSRGVRRSVRMGIWLLILYGLAASIVLFATDKIYLWLGQDASVVALAYDYVMIALWSLIPALVIGGLRSFFTVLEMTRMLLFVTLAGVGVNIGLNYAFIFGNFGAPALGVEGAAVATVGTNALMLLALVGVAMSHRSAKPYELFVRVWRPDWEAFSEIFRLGIPIGVATTAEVGLFAATAVMMGWLGVVPLAAHGIAIQLASISFMIPLGISFATTVRVGHAAGASDQAGIDRAGWAAIWVASIVALAAALVFFLFPGQLIAIFLDFQNDSAPSVLAYAIPLLFVAAIFQLVDSVQVIGVGILRGLKDTKVPMFISLISYWLVGMPAAYLLAFPFGFGGVGLWAGLAIGLLAACILLIGRFRRRTELGLGVTSAA